jgi:hypothetical protein
MPTGDAHFATLLGSDPLTQSYDPCLVIQYFIQSKFSFFAIFLQLLAGIQQTFIGTINACYFSAANGWISRKLSGNNQYQDKMHQISSPCSS